MDAKDLLWVLPLGLGVIYTVDKIGGMGERFEGLGMKTHTLPRRTISAWSRSGRRRGL